MSSINSHPFSIASLTSPSRKCSGSGMETPAAKRQKVDTEVSPQSTDSGVSRLSPSRLSSSDGSRSCSPVDIMGTVPDGDGLKRPEVILDPLASLRQQISSQGYRRSASPGAQSDDSGRSSPQVEPRPLSRKRSHDEFDSGPVTPVNIEPPADGKPPHSYIALISMAILNHPERRMVLSDIYQWIMDSFPYYNNEERAWRNSIRHNLSLNECFIKAGRAENGKGNYWSIHPSCIEDFSRGDYRRRQARRRARTTAGQMDMPAGGMPPIPPVISVPPLPPPVNPAPPGISPAVSAAAALNYQANVGYVPMTSTTISSAFHPYLANLHGLNQYFPQHAASLLPPGHPAANLPVAAALHPVHRAAAAAAALNAAAAAVHQHHSLSPVKTEQPSSPPASPGTQQAAAAFHLSLLQNRLSTSPVRYPHLPPGHPHSNW